MVKNGLQIVMNRMNIEFDFYLLIMIITPHGEYNVIILFYIIFHK